MRDYTRSNEDKLLDPRNQNITLERAAAFVQHETPQVGDVVIFPDGHQRRISYIWGPFEDEETPRTEIQTSYGGQFYLGSRWMNFSGGLEPCIPGDRFERVPGEWAAGSCWFFDHDIQGAGRGVYTFVPVRVWRVLDKEQE